MKVFFQFLAEAGNPTDEFHTKIAREAEGSFSWWFFIHCTLSHVSRSTWNPRDDHSPPPLWNEDGRAQPCHNAVPPPHRDIAAPSSETELCSSQLPHSTPSIPSHCPHVPGGTPHCFQCLPSWSAPLTLVSSEGSWLLSADSNRVI